MGISFHLVKLYIFITQTLYFSGRQEPPGARLANCSVSSEILPMGLLSRLKMRTLLSLYLFAPSLCSNLVRADALLVARGLCGNRAVRLESAP